MEKVLKRQGLEVTEDRIRRAVLADDPKHFHCYDWLSDFFYFTGDHMPNSKEIHLDNQPLFTLYKLYLSEVFGDFVNFDTWRHIWKECFPHVKLRVYKQVTGKCMTCALLTGLRARFANTALKKLVTELHAMHRDMYMAEREAYYNRRQESVEMPDEVMSAISDGMALTHTGLPHFGNLAQSSATLQQKLQGVLDHGRNKFTIYLTMQSCLSGTNLALHTFYMNLENWVEEKGHYPRKVYWQVDGGPENANKETLAFCEYLVSQTPIEEIVLSRLPVGHTHEDIDAMFGTIWEYIRLR